MQIAVVTGGAKGMGRSYSIGLARAGFHVIAVDIDKIALTGLEEKAGSARLSVECRVMDVTDEGGVESGMAEILDCHGRIDVLVNNAGGAVANSRLEQLSLEDWQANLHLNLTSQFLCIRAVLPAMTSAQAGSIINIASTSVASGTTAALYVGEKPANLVAYVAAKGGVIAMTRALARELGSDGIRVNAVSPGFTPTDRVKANFSSRAIDRMVDDQAFKRAQRPDDTIGSVVFLASQESRFITGQNFSVDGGGSMG
jgi:NAD(P)-dependent dehydrogenase (short-subunit alcohol dehydrogenase family)